MKLRFHPQASAELRAAVQWYENERAGLGRELLAEVRDRQELILQAPNLWPTWPDLPDRKPPVRKLRLLRFPYSLAFEVHTDEVVVLALAHDKRRPLYWASRKAES